MLPYGSDFDLATTLSVRGEEVYRGMVLIAATQLAMHQATSGTVSPELLLECINMVNVASMKWRESERQTRGGEPER